MLEKNGVHVAAISYDSPEILRNFAEEYSIGFPLLSDQDSAVIRSFGIFNTNMARDLRSYGVPHPVNYLVSPDGVVLKKYFVPNYLHRVSAAAVAMREFGATDAAAVTITSGPLKVSISLSSERTFAGQELSYAATFTLDPGWHVYGTPLPASFTSLWIQLDDPNVVRQSVEYPAAQPMELAALGETLPVYSGEFCVTGSFLLKFPMAEGPTVLSGRLRFQACGEAICESPHEIAFGLPVMIEHFVNA